MKKQDIVVYALADALVKNPEKVRAFENVINRTIALTSGDGIEIIWTGYYSQSKIEVKGARSGMYIVINVGGRKERKKQEERNEKSRKKRKCITGTMPAIFAGWT